MSDPQSSQHNAGPHGVNCASSRRSAAEEDRAWAYLYASIGDRVTAEEVVRQLDADPHAKPTHLALYVRAKTTLRKQKAADARNQRIGSFVNAIFVGPFRLLARLLASTGAVVVEIVPPTTKAHGGRGSLPRKDPQLAPQAEGGGQLSVSRRERD
jgi:hypothetical protein